MTFFVDSDGAPDPVKLAAAGIVGAARYGRNLTRAQVDGLHAQGLWVIPIDEYAPDDPFHPETGTRDAHRILTQMQACGWPARSGAVAMLTDDRDQPRPFWHLAEEYWANNGPELVAEGVLRGFYCGEDLGDHLLDLKLIDVVWGVGARSWSHGYTSNRIVARQLVAQRTYGVNCDLNQMFVTEFGQYGPTGIMRTGAPVVTHTPFPASQRKANPMEIWKFPDKPEFFVYGVDAAGEWCKHAIILDGADTTTVVAAADIRVQAGFLASLPVRMLMSGDDQLDADFHRLTGL